MTTRPYVLLAAVLALASCSQGSPTQPSAAAPPQATTAQASAPAPAVATPQPAAPDTGTATPPAGPPVAAAEPENCNEADPKKWTGFSYRVSKVEATSATNPQPSQIVQMWNTSSCARVVTWRAFNVLTDSNQPAMGDAVIDTVPAGAMDFRIAVHFYPLSCNAVVKNQTDGRAGRVPNMTHANASFPPGALFDYAMPKCDAPPPQVPPQTPVCVDVPGVPGPWIPGLPPVGAATVALSGTFTVPVECKKIDYYRKTVSSCGKVSYETKKDCEPRK